MLSTNETQTIVLYAQKYNLAKIVLFGSAIDQPDSHDIDLGIKGAAPECFFDIGWELSRDLSRPVDIVDLDHDTQFTRLVEREGVVLYAHPQ